MPCGERSNEQGGQIHRHPLTNVVVLVVQLPTARLFGNSLEDAAVYHSSRHVEEVFEQVLLHKSCVLIEWLAYSLVHARED